MQHSSISYFFLYFISPSLLFKQVQRFRGNQSISTANPFELTMKERHVMKSVTVLHVPPKRHHPSIYPSINHCKLQMQLLHNHGVINVRHDSRVIKSANRFSGPRRYFSIHRQSFLIKLVFQPKDEAIWWCGWEVFWISHHIIKTHLLHLTQ